MYVCMSEHTETEFKNNFLEKYQEIFEKVTKDTLQWFVHVTRTDKPRKSIPIASSKLKLKAKRTNSTAKYRKKSRR
jgi:hypothetical protein